MSFKDRQQANIEILDALYTFFTEHPEQRFCQGLMNLGVLNRVQRHMGAQTWDYFYVDEAHTESAITLNRVFNRLEQIEREKDETNKSTT